MNASRPVKQETDTIAAVATPPGRGGVGILRISGPQAGRIAQQIAGPLPAPRLATLRQFHNATGETLDSGLLLYFPSPGSYTGEDVVELQAHGGQVLLQLLLEAAINVGARHARPGEFTERAFLNERMDLLQAEAVADLIDAGSREAALAAQHSLQGEFSARVNSLSQQIIELRTWIEAAIDFSDEEIDLPKNADLQQRIQTAQQSLTALLRDAENGQVLRDGMAIVILGQPNVGKSSLLNALSGTDTAIVTDIAGTTRDLLHSRIVLDGLILNVTDTAGLRETSDPIEQEGLRRAREASRRSELAMLVIDDAAGITDAERVASAELPAQTLLLPVLNKCDLSGNAAGACETPLGTGVRISATGGAGLDELRGLIKKRAGYRQGDSSPILARQRHRDALGAAAGHLEKAVNRLREDLALELAAEELKCCQQSLGEITGRFSSEDLLGEIFSSFCLGK